VTAGLTDDDIRRMVSAYLAYCVNAGMREVAAPQPPLRSASSARHAAETHVEKPPREESDYPVGHEMPDVTMGAQCAEDARSLDEIRADLGDCRRCRLNEKRTNIVFGEGDPHAELMFIGEGPGADEDAQGRPFVGRAGELLTKMINAMGLDRSQVYIANTVKCRPPGNRDPEPEEIAECLPFLKAQIASVRPKVIVALGRVAARTLLNAEGSLSKLRDKVHDYCGIPVVVTYHPSFLLRKGQDRRYKAEAWADLKEVMRMLGLPIPTPPAR
jgi:DNA polymerase